MPYNVATQNIKHFPKMEKKLKLLSHFDDAYKGTAFNAVLHYIRGGGLQADICIENIERKLNQQKHWGPLQGTNEQWDKYFRDIPYQQQLEEFYEALEYAEEWEKKTPFEKEIEKSERREYFGKQSMKGKEPTEKQIKFLKSKGQENIPNDRYECSLIIDKLMK